jgi:hypothetical protein
MLAGSIGFGIGNALMENLPITNLLGLFTTFGLLEGTFGGLTCGASLGINFSDIKKVLKLSTAGVIWFITGFVLYPLFLVISSYRCVFISPVVIGMIGGALFNVALKKKRFFSNFRNEQRR